MNVWIKWPTLTGALTMFNYKPFPKQIEFFEKSKDKMVLWSGYRFFEVEKINMDPDKKVEPVEDMDDLTKDEAAKDLEDTDIDEVEDEDEDDDLVDDTGDEDDEV